MNKDKRFAAGLIAISLPLMMLAISSPGANASEDPIGSGVQSEVEAIDVCSWELGGFSGNLNLGPADSEAKYEGAALDVSATITGLTLALSGAADSTPLDSSTNCSFYNIEKYGNVEFKLTNTNSFTAKYDDGGVETRDEDMDFSLTSAAPMSIVADANDVAACVASVDGTSWSNTDGAFEAVDETENIFGLAEVENVHADNANVACAPSITVGVTIKSSEVVPAGAGKDYTFSGPTLTITKRSEEITG
jgi:copper chaperone CopZ